MFIFVSKLGSDVSNAKSELEKVLSPVCKVVSINLSPEDRFADDRSALVQIEGDGEAAIQALHDTNSHDRDWHGELIRPGEPFGNAIASIDSTGSWACQEHPERCPHLISSDNIA